MADLVARLTGEDNLSGTLNKVKNELKDIGKETSNIDKIDAKFNKITQSTAPLKKQLRDLKTLGSEMKFNGDYNAGQLLKIAQAAGTAKDSMDDFHALTKFFADDRRWLNTTVQGFQALAGVGSIATGVMTMFGAESENAQKAIMRCQQALAILNGVQAVANLLDKEGYLRTAMKVIGLNAAAAAETKEAMATDVATKSQLKNNAAVMANPYVAAATAIAALVTVIGTWIACMDDASDEQKELNRQVENHKQAVDTQNATLAENIVKFQTLQDKWNSLGNDLNAKKKFIVENKNEFNNLGLKINTVTDAEKAFTLNAAAIIAGMRARAMAIAAQAEMVQNLKHQYEKLSAVEEKIRKGEKLTRAELEDMGIKDPANDPRLKYKGYDAWGLGSLLGSSHEVYEVTGEGAAESLLDGYRTKLEKEAHDMNKPLEKAAAEAWKTAESTPFYNPNGTSGGGSTGGGSGSGGSNTPPKVEEEEHGILLDLNKELEKKNKELDQGNLTLAEQKQKLKEIADLQDRINRIQRARKAATDGTLANALKPQPLKLEPKIDEKKLNEDLAKLMARINSITGGNHFEIMQRQVEENRTKMEAWGDTATAIGQNFSVLGDIFSAVGDSAAAGMMQIAASTAQAVAQIIPQIMALIGAKQGEALAEGTASAAGLPFPANIAAIATIVASVLSVFATIASVAKGFAGGGIIGGGNLYGDHVLARVNSGEMVLNKRQQGRLFKAIESGNIGGGSTVLVPDFRIKGSDLYCSLRNYSKSVGKTGKITGIR